MKRKIKAFAYTAVFALMVALCVYLLVKAQIDYGKPWSDYPISFERNY